MDLSQDSLYQRRFNSKLGSESKMLSSTQVSYRFLALGCFPAKLVSDEKEQKKQKIETVNSYIKNLLTDTCESRDKVYMSF